jgi:hypothetical protein
MSFILLNVGYIIFVMSPMCKEVIQLRIVLLIATTLFIIWSLIEGLWNNVGWNLIFGGMHVWQLSKLVLAERRAVYSDELEQARQQLFPALRKSEFHQIVKRGQIVEQANVDLITAGQTVDSFYILLVGQCRIDSGAGMIWRHGYCLFGEVALITGQSASATVTADGTVRLLQITMRDWRELAGQQPQIESGVHSCIGRQLGYKLADVSRLREFNAQLTMQQAV